MKIISEIILSLYIQKQDICSQPHSKASPACGRACQ